MIRPEWMADAVCAGTDAEAFFPTEGTRDYERAAVKAMCSSCPVRTACLEYALDNREQWGVWGGLTEHERRPLLKDRPRRLPPITHGTEAGAKQHRRRNEAVCAPCLTAENAASRARKAS